jgi:hypothetical protein
MKASLLGHRHALSTPSMSNAVSTVLAREHDRLQEDSGW